MNLIRYALIILWVIVACYFDYRDNGQGLAVFSALAYLALIEKHQSRQDKKK